MFSSQPFTSELVMSNPKWFRYEIIWEKERPTNIFFMKKQIGKVHENILVFYKHQPTYNPQMEERTFDGRIDREKYDSYNNNGSLTHRQPKYKPSADYNPQKRYPRSVIRFNRDLKKGKDRHPTQKPVKLLEWLIGTYSNEGDLILDPVAGSGSTGVACINTGRKYVLFEKNKRFYEQIKEKLEKES